MFFQRDTRDRKNAGQRLAVIEPHTKIIKAKLPQNLTRRRTNLCLHNHRSRPKDIDVALIEFSEPPAGGTIRPPHRLNLITLEKLRQLVAILRHNAREWHRQIVTQREISFARALMHAAFQYLEDELVPFFAILPHQRLNVLGSRRLQRFETVALVDL